MAAATVAQQEAATLTPPDTTTTGRHPHRLQEQPPGVLHNQQPGANGTNPASSEGGGYMERNPRDSERTQGVLSQTFFF